LLRLGKLVASDLKVGVYLPMKNKLYLSTFLLLAALANCLAQVPDSVRATLQQPVFQRDTLPTDSLLATQDSATLSPTPPVLPDSLQPKRHGIFHRIFISDYPNPKKALYLSLAFPAGGQLYNRRWWKAPIVWGGYAALIVAADYNTKGYKLFRDAYLAELHGEPHPFEGRLNAGDLKTRRDAFDKNKQLSYIGMFALHLLQTAEAFVDCHLKTFDVSDDLSFRFKPSLEASFPSQYPAMGVGVAFYLGK
jgi:hypothetical protein